MAIFRYQALDAAGHSVAGELEADNVQQAVAELEARALTLQTIGYATAWPPAHSKPATSETAEPPARTSTTTQPFACESLEQTVLRSHMETILARGEAIMPALLAYAEEMPAGGPRRQLLAVSRVLASRDTAAATAALAEMPDYWIPLLSAAISSNEPGRVLHEFLSESQRTAALRHQWWLTLAYPILLAGLAAVVMVALSVFVIPQFAEIFNDFNLELPGLTQLVLTLAWWLSHWGVWLITGIVLAFILLLLYANRLVGSTTLGWFGDRFRPPFARRTAIARFARFTADLLEAGVTMPDALRIAGFTVNRSRLQRAAWALANDIETRSKVPERMEKRALSATIMHALLSEMTLESRVRLLREISTCHADRIRIGLSWTSGIVEPVAIALVGFWIGLVVIGLFLPLVKLIEGLSG